VSVDGSRMARRKLSATEIRKRKAHIMTAVSR
jgi:hypothetical protein